MSKLSERNYSLEALKTVYGVGVEKTENTNTNYVNNYYPFWLMQTGQRVVIRFLPDLNENNPHHFMVEKVMHHLTINGQERKIPCLSMYGEDCPICKISQAYYKVKDEVNGKKYWKKKQNITQAIIIEDPLPPNPETGETHVGKVRIITLGFQILNVIKEGFADPDLEGHPADVNNGCDFIIKKSEQGKHASYAVGTKFTNKPRALTDVELLAAEEGMVDLTTLLPKNPGFEVVQALLDAEMNGEEYIENKYSRTPAHEDETEWEAPKTAAPKVSNPVANDENTSSDTVDDMLQQIRARRKKATAE